MDLTGSSFFYALAAISMTFVGFAAIVIALRQGTGLALTPLQILTTKQYIEFGLAACGFAMLAPFLSLCGLSDDATWRAASAIILVLRSFLFAVYPRRRKRAAPDEALPLRFWINLAIFAAIAVTLAGNVVGWPYAPQAAPVALAACHTLVVAAALFLRTFKIFLDR